MSRLSEFDKRWVQIDHDITESRLKLTAECRAYTDVNARRDNDEIADLKAKVARIDGMLDHEWRGRSTYDFKPGGRQN